MLIGWNTQTKTERRLARDRAWEQRGVVIRRLKDAGATVRYLTDPRHLRVGREVGVWFDFWPSTGRWNLASREGAKHGPKGYGVDGLLDALAQGVAPR